MTCSAQPTQWALFVLQTDYTTQQIEIQLSMICHYAYSNTWHKTWMPWYSQFSNFMNPDGLVDKVSDWRTPGLEFKAQNFHKIFSLYWKLKSKWQNEYSCRIFNRLSGPVVEACFPTCRGNIIKQPGTNGLSFCCRFFAPYATLGYQKFLHSPRFQELGESAPYLYKKRGSNVGCISWNKPHTCFL